MKLLVIHGPNLNLLGERETGVYGNQSLSQLNDHLRKLASDMDLQFETFQSNHEGEIIGRLQEARHNTDVIILNPGGYTHTSVAIRDAIAAIDTPVIEVHLSNIFARESFRHTSLIAPVCAGSISGFGVLGYELAIQAAKRLGSA